MTAEHDPARVPSAVRADEAVPPGTSVPYSGGPPWRRFLGLYPLGSMAFLAVQAAVIGIMLPNQIQSIVSGRFFTGDDAGVDIAALSRLQRAVADGASASPDQLRLLELLGRFDDARAQALALVVTLGLIGAMVVQPVVGVVSDRTRSALGRRGPWILVGALGGAAGLVLMSFAGSVAVVAVLWFLTNTLVNVAWSAFNAVMADRVPDDKLGRVSAVWGLGNLVGGIAASAFAGLGFASLGFDIYIVFAVVLAGCLTSFVLVARDQSSRALHTPPFDLRVFLRGFLVPLRDHDFRLVWAARVVLYFGYTVSTALSFFMLQSYITPALSAAEATRMVPLLAGAVLPGTLVGMAISGWLSDRLGRRKPFVITASLLMAVSMAVPLLCPTLSGLFVQVVVSGLAFGMYIPVDQALFVEVLPDRAAAGRDLGVATLATNLGQSLGPLVAGQVVAISGGYGGVWVVALVLLVAAAVVVVPVRRVR